MTGSATVPAAAPSDLVTFTIETEGKPVSETYHVLGIKVVKAVNKVPVARITLADGDAAKEDFPVSNTADFIPGNSISILAGYHNDHKPIFRGTVIRHSISAKSHRSSTLVIECKDPAVALTIGRKNKLFHTVEDSDAIKEILGTYSDKGVKTGTLDDTSVTHKELLQYQATDWDFILSRAEANGKLLLVDDGVMSVKAPDLSTEPVLELRYGATMLSFEAEIDARDQRQTAKGFSWNPALQEIAEAEGVGSSSAEQAAEAGGADSGSAEPAVEAEGADSGSAEQAAEDPTRSVSPESYDLHGTQLPEEELQAWADALLLRSHLAKVRGHVSFQGDANVKPGNMISLNGVGERFNGKVFVATVRHEITGGNWITEVQFGLAPEHFTTKRNISLPPAAGLLPAISGLQTGVVSQLQEDPDGEDRVLVNIPVIDGEDEGVWARIASLDAGENRGAFFRPEIKDEVIMGFINDDPRHPVILGMLHSSAKPAPITATDNNHEKGFISREKLKILFNDDEKVITLETPNKNIITLSDKDGGISLEDKNGNSITMNADGITLKSAKDVIIKATGDVKTEGVNIAAKAKAGTEIASGRNTVIKGAMVMIN